MKTLALLSLATTASAAISYTTWTADSFITRGVPKSLAYATAVLYEGIEAAYELSGNETYKTWYKSRIDAFINANGSITGWRPTYYSLDDLRIGNNLLWWYNQTGDEKYKTAAGTVRNQLARFPRTPSGGFWHRDPTYPNQMWLDGIFMAQPFYAKYTALFDAGNSTAWNDIILQFDLIEAHCRNETTGLLVHGFDESKKAVWADSITGAAPHVWDRAVGWYFLALMDVLEVFPETQPGREKLLKYFQTLAVALRETQDASGGWWLIMDEPYLGMKGNYIESSATAMFTYGFLRGTKLGYIEGYETVAEQAYDLITSKFVKKNGDGTLNWEGTVEVGSLGSNGTYEYYISVPLATNDFKGAGPFMWASYERETR